MTDIHLTLPDPLVRRCTKSAEALGISPTELIRMAMEHELAGINRCMERAAMAEALKAMDEDPVYENECAVLEAGFMAGLPNEPEHWWRG